LFDGNQRQGGISIKALLKMQLTATILVPLLFLADEEKAVLSALIGGGIAFTATALQGIRFIQPYRAQCPEALLTRILLSELTKMILIAVLFAMVFVVLHWIRPMPTFLGFIVVYLTPLLAAAFGRPKASRQG
jgi:F0F1-type ATP synthase assembly protein I